MNSTLLPGFARPALLLLALTLLLALPQAALPPLIDRDEPRFAEASREMLQSGNFVVPTFNLAPRYAKPPLIYWCQASSFLLFGENAFAARLPSLLAVAATALILFRWGRALGSHEAGLIAALAYALCLQTMQQGRVATADALLIFFMTLAGFAAWRMLDLVRTGHGSWNLWGLILAFAFAGGFLAKGPEALLPIVPVFISARWMGWRGLASFALILALALLMVAAWAVPAFVQTHGAYWREGLGHDVGDRMITGFQGHGASGPGGYLLLLPFYLVLFWISALPWSPLAIAHAGRLRGAASFDATDRFLVGNAALVFLVFTLMSTKLPHYTLPAFPFLALLFARRWMAAGLPAATPLRVLLVFGLAATLLAWIALPAWLPNGGNFSPAGVLVRKAGPALTPDSRAAMADYSEPNGIWELRRIVRAPIDQIPPAQADQYLRQPGPRAVLISRSALDAAHLESSTYQKFEARGFNTGLLRKLDLVLLVKSAGSTGPKSAGDAPRPTP